MKYRCNTCEKEMNLAKGARFCPTCGTELERVIQPHTGSLKDKVIDKYNAGTPVRQIAVELKANTLTVCEIVTKALLPTGVVPNFVQMEYVDEIKSLVGDGQLKQLKPIKEQLPAECTYETIAYVVNEVRREKAVDRRAQREAAMEQLHKDILAGKAIEDIKNETGLSNFVIERAVVDLINTDPEKGAAYLQTEYEDEILNLASEPEWDGTLKTLKDRLPEDCTYITIKAVLSKHN